MTTQGHQDPGGWEGASESMEERIRQIIDMSRG